jgi:ABC-type Na+ efflux pump permease subunit
MLWKEVYRESNMRLGWLGGFLMLLFAVLAILPCGIILWWHFYGDGPAFSYQRVGQSMNIYVRMVGTILACLLWLAVGVRAASSIGAERDRQTLESLLSAPLSLVEIIFAKWVGSLASGRWLFALIGVIWSLGLITGGLHPFALPIVAAALVVYSCFFASLGMFFAAWCKTTLRAILWTVGISLLVGGIGQLLLGFIIAPILQSLPGPRIEWPLYLLIGLAPPIVQGMSAIHGSEFGYSPGKEMLEIAVFSVAGGIAFGLAALLLWMAALDTFRRSCGRIVDKIRRPPIDSRPRMDKPTISA